MSESTTTRYVQMGRMLVAHLEAEGISSIEQPDAPEAMTRWLTSRVHVGGPRYAQAATMRLRRTALVSMIAIASDAGRTLVVPAVRGTVARSEIASRRALRDDEVERLQGHLLTKTAPRMSAAVALALCGAAASEIWQITADHIQLEAVRVLLPGGPRLCQRTVDYADEWCAQVLREGATRVQAQALLPDPQARLAYAGRDQGDAAASAVATLVNKALAGAGLTDNGIGSHSLRAWAGARTYRETGDIVEAARHLGLDSLDRTAAEIGLHWQEETDA